MSAAAASSTMTSFPLFPGIPGGPELLIVLVLLMMLGLFRLVRRRRNGGTESSSSAPDHSPREDTSPQDPTPQDTPTEDVPPQEDPADDPTPSQWQELVIEDVDERSSHTRVTLRNTTDQVWDLSGATLIDDVGEKFTVREGLTISPQEELSIPVDASIELTPGVPVVLQVESGPMYELPWRRFLDGGDGDSR